MNFLIVKVAYQDVVVFTSIMSLLMGAILWHGEFERKKGTVTRSGY
jgi:hypothetical protein